jgi:hypothetical protein
MQLEIEFQPLHAAQNRLKKALTGRDVIRAGRRWGKTTLLEQIYARKALSGRHVGWFAPLYRLLTPSYRRLYQILYPAILHASKSEGLIRLHPLEGQTQGGSIEFWSLDSNPDAGRSRAYDDAIIDEASLVEKELRETVEQAITPTLLDRRGTLILAGTPKGINVANYFYLACTDKTLGYTEHYAPTRDNPLLDPLGVASLQEKNSPLVYLQEYLAEFVDWGGEAFFPLDKLLYGGAAIAYPAMCDAVFAVIDTATKTGKTCDGTGVTYWAYARPASGQDCAPIGGPPLILLDWDLRQIEGSLLIDWLPKVYERLNEFTRTIRTRYGSQGVHIEDKASGMILLQQAARMGLQARAIESKLTALGKSERAISVSGYVHRDMVKVSDVAYNKVSNYKGVTKNHLVSQVTGFRIGVKDQVDDDLLDCWCYGAAIALGNLEGF